MMEILDLMVLLSKITPRNSVLLMHTKTLVLFKFDKCFKLSLETKSTLSSANSMSFSN